MVYRRCSNCVMRFSKRITSCCGVGSNSFRAAEDILKTLTTPKATTQTNSTKCERRLYCMKLTSLFCNLCVSVSLRLRKIFAKTTTETQRHRGCFDPEIHYVFLAMTANTNDLGVLRWIDRQHCG